MVVFNILGKASFNSFTGHLFYAYHSCGVNRSGWMYADITNYGAQYIVIV